MQRIVPAILVLCLSAPTFSAGIAGHFAKSHVNTAINAIAVMPPAWQQQIGQFLTSPNFTAGQLHAALNTLNEQSPYKSQIAAPIEQAAVVSNTEKSLANQDSIAIAQKLGELNIVLAPYLGSERAAFIDAAKQARKELVEEKRRGLDISLRRTVRALGISIELSDLGFDGPAPVLVVDSGKKSHPKFQLQKSPKPNSLDWYYASDFNDRLNKLGFGHNTSDVARKKAKVIGRYVANRALRTLKPGDRLHATKLENLRDIYTDGRMKLRPGSIYIAEVKEDDIGNNHVEAIRYSWAGPITSSPVLLKIRSTPDSPLEFDGRHPHYQILEKGIIQIENIEVFLPSRQTWLPLQEFAHLAEWKNTDKISSPSSRNSP